MTEGTLSLAPRSIAAMRGKMSDVTINVLKNARLAKPQVLCEGNSQIPAITDNDISAHGAVSRSTPSQQLQEFRETHLVPMTKTNRQKHVRQYLKVAEGSRIHSRPHYVETIGPGNCL